MPGQESSHPRPIISDRRVDQPVSRAPPTAIRADVSRRFSLAPEWFRCRGWLGVGNPTRLRCPTCAWDADAQVITSLAKASAPSRANRSRYACAEAQPIQLKRPWRSPARLRAAHNIATGATERALRQGVPQIFKSLPLRI
jgi:hypothetical protein